MRDSWEIGGGGVAGGRRYARICAVNKDLFAYFLILLVPLCVLPFAVHRFLSAELAHGRTLGRAYLGVEAQRLAAEMAAARTLTPPAADRRLPVSVAVVDSQGRTDDHRPFPPDGRCFGAAPLAPAFPDRFVRVAWPGSRSPGSTRAHTILFAEGATFAACGFFLLLGCALLSRAILRARRAARTQLDSVADFTHRLKTPLTSIALCADLARAGRLSDAHRRESLDTIAQEAAKLNTLVDEVLAYAKACRHV